MNLFIAHRKLSQLLLSLGRMIARHPFYFMITPVILSSSLFFPALPKIRSNRNYDYLFVRENGLADQNRRFVENLFPTNTSKLFDIPRIINSKSFVMIQVIPKDGGSIFRELIVKDILDLDNIVRNVSVNVRGKSFNYEAVCGKVADKCVRSNFLDLAENYRQIQRGKYKIKYPVDINNVTNTVNEYVFSLGGVDVDDYGYMKEVRAIRLMYGLDISNKTKLLAIERWKNKLDDSLRTVKFQSIHFYSYSQEMVENELEKFGHLLISLMPFVIIIIVLFTSLSLMTNDCVRSKPWLGPAAFLSAILAVASGFSFVFHLGIEYIDYAIFLCYLISVLEIDDAFVLIGAWRSTNPSDNVEKRMGECFHQAGVSITITSLTNFSSMCVGIASPFPILRIFCTYAASSMFFSYLHQITFFGACIALSGYREERMQNPFFINCRRDRTDLKSYEDVVHKKFINKQLWEKLGHLLTLKPTKVLVILLFIANLSIGLYGLKFVKRGLNFFDMPTSDSNLPVYANSQYKYFGKYSNPVQVIVNQPLNYADERIRNMTDNILERFEALRHIADSSVRMSWLKYYKYFNDIPVGQFLLRGYNMSAKQDFIDGLRQVFLKFPITEQFKQDIVFNDDYTEITATRYVLLTKDVYSQETESKHIQDLITLTDSFSMKIKFFIYTHRLFDENIAITQQIIQTGVIATSLVCIICFISFPSFIFAICVSLVICCTIIEVIGYISLWNVNLDIFFLSAFILCVGISVNHPAHMSYFFMMSKSSNLNERIKNSFCELGFPIIQGSLSTILGISVISYFPMYISLSGIKLIGLFVLQTSFHSLFVVPIFLSILSSLQSSVCSKLLSGEDVEFTEINQSTNIKPLAVET